MFEVISLIEKKEEMNEVPFVLSHKAQISFNYN